MSSARRYSEREIAAIFEQAAAAQDAAQQDRPPHDGLSLNELQQIGRESGIAPSFIAQAAATVDRSVSAPPPTTYFSLPIGVTRSADLPGSLSEEGWDRLVVDLRETFRARGNVHREGSLREWRNGNLYALAEPTADGHHRLRLGTRKGNAPGMLAMGMSFFIVSLVFLVLLLSGDGGLYNIVMSVLFGLTGLGTVGGIAVQLARWSATRERQMEAILNRTTDRMVDAPAASLHESQPLPSAVLNASSDHPETIRKRSSSARS